MLFLTLKTPMLASWMQIYQRKDTKVVSYVRYEPISGQHSQFIPLENPKKTKAFWCYQEMQNGSISQTLIRSSNQLICLYMAWKTNLKQVKQDLRFW